MKKSTKNKIEESIKDLESIGGLDNPAMKKVIVKLKLALDNEAKSKN